MTKLVVIKVIKSRSIPAALVHKTRESEFGKNDTISMRSSSSNVKMAYYKIQAKQVEWVSFTELGGVRGRSKICGREKIIFDAERVPAGRVVRSSTYIRISLQIVGVTTFYERCMGEGTDLSVGCTSLSTDRETIDTSARHRVWLHRKWLHGRPLIGL